MFDDNRDLNRDLGRRDAYLDDPAVRDGSGYGPVIALVAIALVIGGLFMFSPRGDNQQTAANNPAVERSAPPPATPAPTPPVTAPKQ
jgi:hypothetical protein